ncbi:rpn2, partial [Symbiodinium sp. KB8]
MMAKMGAVLGAGIIDAGGRNSVIALRSRAGFAKMSSIVGMAIWLQHWYWFPLAHFLSLSFAPTPLIGLNENLEMPKEEKGEEKKAVKTVELSTTARNRAKARGKKHTQEEGDVDMDDGSTKKDTSADEKATSKAEEPTAEGKDDKSEKEKAKKEPAEP